MFDLEKAVQNVVWNILWLRWTNYFKNNLVKNLQIYENDDGINFDADAIWNEKYETWIVIDPRKQNEIKFICSCPAFQDIWSCKHLAWLAMKVADEYKISDKFEIFSKKTGEKLDLSENEDYEKEEDELFNNLWWNIPPNILKMLWYAWNIYEKEEQKVDPLGIFRGISNQKNLENKQIEENLYKIKIWFSDISWRKEDISINLYKAKILKNWSLSTGTLVRREFLNSAPSKFLLLSPFLESQYGNWYSSNNRITFSSSPEIFIDILSKFEEILDTSNKKIFFHKEIFELKVDIKQKEENYLVSLFLLLNWEKIKLSWKLFWDDNNPFFAIIDSKNNLRFFKSDLNAQFLKSLASKEIALKKEEFEELKKKEAFHYLLENSLDIENLWINFEIIDPKVILKIEIPEDYSSVKVEKYIAYSGTSFMLWSLEKSVLFDGKKIIKRTLEKEHSELKKLENLNSLFDEVFLNISKKNIDDKIDDFFDEIENCIASGIQVEYKQTTKKITTWKAKIHLQINSWIDFFDVKSSFTIWDKEVENAQEILSQIKKWNKFIVLANGNTLILKNDLKKEAKTLEALWMSEKDIWKDKQIGKYTIWLLKDDVKKSGFLHFDLDNNAKNLREKFKDFKNIEKVILKKDSKITLRDYQKTGVNWINFLQTYNFSGILADDMWLGKTVQTLAFLEKMYASKEKKWKTLIICPTSLVLNWMDEAEKFTPELKVAYIKDGKTWFESLEKWVQIIIVSYGIMANLASNFKETFEYIILDEAQNIKNPLAQRTKAIWELKSKNRLALSGTPIENNLVELWSIFHFLMPWFLGNLNNFKSNYSGWDKETLDILSKKVKPFILRRTKEEVLKDLPPKVEEHIKLEMWVKQKAFYDKLKNAYKLKIGKQIESEWLNKARFDVLDALLKLRQACLMPELVSSLEWNHLKESIKLEYLEENIEEMIGKWHNLLIFSQFTGFLAYVKELLDNKKIAYNYLDWQTKPQDRKKWVDSFNAGKVNVFIISLKAGWTGLNLTSADYVIHLDPWWNPAVENQATDRAHRMWQQKTVFVQKLIVKDSIEEKILLLQENKRKLIDDVFSGNFSGSLEKSDIDFIFS